MTVWYQLGRSKAQHVSVRMRVIGSETFEPKIDVFAKTDPVVVDGTIEPGWERILVLTSSDAGLRLFELVPAEEASAVDHHGFYVRGMFRVEKKVNSSREAVHQWASRFCQAVQTDRETQEQRDCGKPATHSAYDPPIYFCDECLHQCMEDASPGEQKTVKKL